MYCSWHRRRGSSKKIDGRDGSLISRLNFFSFFIFWCEFPSFPLLFLDVQIRWRMRTWQNVPRLQTRPSSSETSSTPDYDQHIAAMVAATKNGYYWVRGPVINPSCARITYPPPYRHRHRLSPRRTSTHIGRRTDTLARNNLTHTKSHPTNHTTCAYDTRM